MPQPLLRRLGAFSRSLLYETILALRETRVGELGEGSVRAIFPWLFDPRGAEWFGRPDLLLVEDGASAVWELDRVAAASIKRIWRVR
jgi:hypothetical protein